MERTDKQNKSLHKLFRIVADEAQNKGITVKMMNDLLPNAEILVTPYIIKEIWRTFQIKTLGKTSTTELTTKEVDEVFEPFSAFMATNFDVVIDFPSIKELFRKKYGY